MTAPSRRRPARPPAPIRPGPVSRTEAAYRAIKREILTNGLRPGDVVPQERFVRQLQLSRTPVREAVLQLAREGFVDIRPRMGTFVSHLDLRQIQEMYAVRGLLEGHASRLAATRIPAGDLAAIERDLRSQRTEGEINCSAVSEAGERLHRLIISSCGNRVLARMILSVQDHFARFRTLSLQIPEKVLSSHREHLAILEALKDRNPERAEQRLRSHLDHAGRYLMESLLHAPAGAAGAPVVVSVAG